MVRQSNWSVCWNSIAIAVCCAALAPHAARGQDTADPLPEGPGLAANYPGDHGLADDPRVVFVEDFEQPSLDDVRRRWESVSHPEIMSLSDAVPAGTSGTQSLLLSHVGGQEGGHLYRRLPPGHDKLHIRFYVKFDPECARIHHFFHIGGYNPPTPYPQGGAGERPRGNERFTVGIEPFGDDWTWDYYTYWMEMRGSPPRGQTWGNTFIRDPQLKVARGEWICVETMIKLNDVGQSNGELALWIDGKRVSHVGPGFPKGKWVYDKFEPGAGGEGVRWSDARRGPENFTVPREGAPFEGFRWRNDERLKLNFLWVLLYMTGIPEGHVSKVWFDHIVVARDYIGPLAAAAERKTTMRIGAAQPKSRLIDYRLSPHDALVQVDRSLEELAQLIDQAGAAGCDVLALPEDTLGLGTWEAGNQSRLSEALPAGVDRMLERLGRAAGEHNMYLVCCNDTVDAAGAVRNTAFLLGRDGKEIGRYHKVNMPIHELSKQRGDGFPVFPTEDLGDVGMLICYDMVFPEAARSLALGGADIIFHPTLGGAAFGEGDISRAAFRTRAAENFVYVVVSQRGAGSMIISPQGTVLAEAEGTDVIAIADVDPSGGRAGGDAFNHQRDMRARLFRERSPAAFGILTDPHPPVLDKAPETVPIADAVRIANGALTVGAEEFRQAEDLVRTGRTDDAVQAFEALSVRYPATWIDRVSRERVVRLRGGS